MNPSEESRPGASVENGGTVVIVDDNPNNLRVLSNILEQQGFKVRPALNGEMALRSITLAPPELVLLDIRMPEMDGFEVCRRLKLDERTREVPVIFISALNETEDKVAAFRAGGVDYIAKPFQMEEVMARVQAHLKLYRMQVQLESLVAERTGELRAAYASLQSREEQYRRLVENAPDILYIYSSSAAGSITPRGSRRCWAGARSTCWPIPACGTGASTRTTCRGWRPPSPPPPAANPSISNTASPTPAGAWHWLHDRSISIQPREGEALIEGLASDITDRKQAEASLHRANRALHTLSASNAALIRVENEAQLLNEVCRTRGGGGRAPHGPGAAGRRTGRPPAGAGGAGAGRRLRRRVRSRLGGSG
jgi:CheY-like chemotaxis protein